MEELSEIKINNQVTIKNVDEIVKTYLKVSIFTGIKLTHLRLLCELKEGKRYIVEDVCKSCKRIKIKIGKFYLPIKFNHIDQIF